MGTQGKQVRDAESRGLMAPLSEMEHLVYSRRMSGHADPGDVQRLEQFDRNVGELLEDAKA